MERIVYRNHDGRFIKGLVFNIILQDEDYYLIDLKVYADGHIDCLGGMDLKKLKALLDAGKLTRELPENGKLFIPHVGYIRAAHATSPGYSHERFIKIIEDTIKRLNENFDTKSECIRRFKEYLIEPSESNLNTLKETYFLLPSMERALFEIAYKDPLVKFMTTEQKLTREERAYLLRDYFDGEWFEMK